MFSIALQTCSRNHAADKTCLWSSPHFRMREECLASSIPRLVWVWLCEFEWGTNRHARTALSSMQAHASHHPQESPGSCSPWASLQSTSDALSTSTLTNVEACKQWQVSRPPIWHSTIGHTLETTLRSESLLQTSCSQDFSSISWSWPNGHLDRLVKCTVLACLSYVPASVSLRETQEPLH